MARNQTTENINHVAGIRFRVTGAGNLRLNVETLDAAFNKELVPIAMTTPARIEPFRIVNFVSQKARFTIYTDDFDDVMRINKIVIFLKPIFTQYPGN